MDFIIRAAQPSDNGFARTLVQDSLAFYGIEAEFNGLDAAVGLIGLPESQNLELVGVSDGKICGCAIVANYTNGVGKLFGFHVAPEFRGKGLGQKLLRASYQIAYQYWYKGLILDTAASMQAAVHLYERDGWQRISDPIDITGADRSYCLDLEGYFLQSPIKNHLNESELVCN